MRFAVLYSKKDQAGRNIARQLKKLFLPDIPIIELKKETIFSENIDKDSRLKNIDFIVFASKHQSKEQRKTLSLHAPGNWRGSDFGGKPGKTCPTSSLVLKYLFQKLNENLENAKQNKQLYDFELTLECTHHGPYLEKPCCFIEIGSSENEWENEKAGEIIAKTISSLQNFKQSKSPKIKTAVGIGGPHYCHNFNKIQLNSKYALSHIIPKYSLPLTESILKEAIEKTQEHVDLILIDWKGLGKSEERQKIMNLLKKSGIEFKRTSEVSRETNEPQDNERETE